ncbi:MAG: T9SS type A sorting domain-containing protein, partial [Bacteroidetes bacterium]|nr:T9SS type A sorting domain-containing protein [Bacteroidota bacterium]
SYLQNNIIDCTIFPNPANNFINIIIHNVNNKAAIQLVDLFGKVISQNEITLNSNYTYKQLDVSNLQKGMYILKISSAKGIISKKVIIN